MSAAADDGLHPGAGEPHRACDDRVGRAGFLGCPDRVVSFLLGPVHDAAGCGCASKQGSDVAAHRSFASWWGQRPVRRQDVPRAVSAPHRPLAAGFAGCGGIEGAATFGAEAV